MWLPKTHPFWEAILVKPKWQPILLLAGYTEFSYRVVLMLSTLKKFCLTATDEVCVIRLYENIL